MNTQKLKTVLEETFCANFMSYYRSHVAHVNTIGRNFFEDHRLLQDVYTYFQENIDTIAEKLRSIRAKMPADLMTVCMVSPIPDMPTEGTSDELLRQVHEVIEIMVDQYHALNEAAEEVDYIDLSNFAQDQIGHLVKFRWMLEATLEMEEEEDEEDE